MFEKFFRRWTCRHQFLIYRFLDIMQIYCTVTTRTICNILWYNIYFKMHVSTFFIHFLHVFLLSSRFSGRGLGRRHRSVALGALELGGVFLQRRLRGPGAPDGRVLRLGEKRFCKFKGFVSFFLQRFYNSKPLCMSFAWVLHCACVLSVARSSIQWSIFELLRQARSSIICLWDCNQLQIGGRNDHKKSFSHSDSHFSVSICVWVFFQ